MWVRLLLFYLFVVGVQTHIFGQCAAIDFSISPSVCLNERIVVEDTGMASLRDWDFCSGDFSQAPSAQLDYTLSAALGRPGIEFAKDGNLWYAFVTGTWANTLYRVRFANGINNAPTSVENLGDLGGKLIGPGQVRIMKEDNNWFGLINNAGSPGGELLKLSFGDKLSNSISVTTLASGMTNLNSGLAVGRDEIDGWICILTNSINQFTIIKLGFNISAPLPTDIINSVAVPDQNNLGDVDLIKECDEWFGFAQNFGNGNLYRLKFGTQLFSAPTIEKLTGTDVVNGGRLRIVKEGTEFFLLSTSLGGVFYKTSFGNDLNNPTPVIINEGSFGTTLQNSYGLGVAKENSVWNISVIDQGTGKISKVNYSPTCPAVVDDPDIVKPIVHYSLPGTYTVALTKSFAGISVSKSKSISVSNSIASEIDFTTQNNCAQNDVIFQVQGNVATIMNYDWNFGDTNTSAQSNPIHQYGQAGNYEAILKVTSNNGCKNLVKKAVIMYNKPIADFTLPIANPYCTNQSYNFGNTSSFDIVSDPTWEWSLNGIVVSSALDLLTQFSTDQSQEIKLKSSIPGCESEMVKSISSVQSGPLTDFTFSTSCEDVPVSFINTTTGAVVEYTWDFNDGNTSMQQNAINTFEDAGRYQVTLRATNLSGCQNFISKEVIVYSKPTANFSLALPPFSCSGAASQFTDLTPPPTDSNITSWNWTFGDNQNNTSTNKNPTHVYANAGEYVVSLQVATNFGCEGEVTKNITIAQTPEVDFSSTALCVNQPTTFTPTSTTDIKAWLWGIQNVTYTTQNPVHTFTTSGNQTVTMAATGNNNCVKMVAKNLTVPIPVTINFSATSTCAGKPAVFTETSLAGTDPAVSWNWDFAGQATATTSTAQHIFPSTGNYNVRLNSTRQSGCTYTSTRNIAISQAPVAQFTVSNESGGAPLAVGFVNTSSGATSWLWNFNDADQTTSTEFSPAFTYTQLGTYSAELIAMNNLGCTDSFVKNIFVVEPEVNVAVTNLLLIANNDGTMATVTFENRSNVVLVNPEIILDLSGKAKIKERVFGTFLPGQESTKSISTRIVSDNMAYICAEISVTGDVNSFDNRACNNLTGELEVVAPYPNPADNELILEWIRGEQNEVEVRLINAQGQLVLNKRYFNLSSGLNQLLVKVDALLPGLYFATVADGNKTISYKVLIHH